MDKVNNRKKIVKEILQEIIDFFPKDAFIELLPVIDDERGQYLIYCDGWQESRRDYACFFHIEVKPNGKVYLRHDGTDLVLADKLLEKDIPASEIVLAFHAPYKRPWTEFALA